MASRLDRLAAAWKALVGIFSDESARQAYGLLSGVFPASIGAPPTRGSRERIAAFADMPWLHAVAGKVAAGFAAVDWQLRAVRRAGAARAVRAKDIQRMVLTERKAALAVAKAAGELIEVADHPLLDLLGGGNSYMTGLDLRRLTALYLDLEGEAFWIKERNGLGVPVAAWPVSPAWVQNTPTPSNRFFRVSFRGWQGNIPDTEILWLVSHDPANPYARGSGMARALADELETDEYAARFTRQTFLNQNRPDFIIYPKAPSTWNEPERARLQQEWRAQHEGFWRAMRARFASREVGVYEFGETSMRNLQMVQLREFERDLIRQVWGVPPVILGLIEPGQSRATAEVENFIFAKWVLQPRLEAFRAMLQERLVPEYDDRLILDYTSPVKEDREFYLEAAKGAPWAPTVDEWRRLQGLEPLGGEAGARHALPITTTFVSLGDADAGLESLSTDELLDLRKLVAKISRR